jgi:hypothetical protein
MGDLQQVDLRQAAPEQLGVDPFLDIARQEEAMPADLTEKHDRDVVDPRAAIGWSLGDAPRIRPQHAEPDAVEGQPVARREPAVERAASLGEERAPRPVARTRPDHPRLVHAPDAVPGQ